MLTLDIANHLVGFRDRFRLEQAGLVLDLRRQRPRWAGGHQPGQHESRSQQPTRDEQHGNNSWRSLSVTKEPPGFLVELFEFVRRDERNIRQKGSFLKTFLVDAV